MISCRNLFKMVDQLSISLSVIVIKNEKKIEAFGLLQADYIQEEVSIDSGGQSHLKVQDDLLIHSQIIGLDLFPKYNVYLGKFRTFMEELGLRAQSDTNYSELARKYSEKIRTQTRFKYSFSSLDFI